MYYIFYILGNSNFTDQRSIVSNFLLKEIIEKYLYFNWQGPYKIDFYEEQEISYVIIIRRKDGRKSNSKSLFGSGRSLYKKFWNSFKELLRVSSLLLNISAFILCVRYITCVLVCAHVGMICENTTCLKANWATMLFSNTFSVLY